MKVNVKWGKEKHEVEIDEPGGDDALDTFRAQLFALTGVPVERQKIMLKGKMMKADTDMAKLKEGAKVMLMGSADKAPEAPKEKIVFMEDMTAEEKTSLTGAPGGGLHNLGNTCYMNSTLQCLRAITPLKDALNNHMRTAQLSHGGDVTKILPLALGKLFKDLDVSPDAVTPMQFTHAFRTAFPQFAQKSPQGQFMQQDAEECLGSLFTTLGNELKAVPDGLAGNNTIDALFGGDMQVTQSCPECKEEAEVQSSERFTRLKCFIDNETNALHEGLGLGLQEELEKRSAVLGRNAVFKKQHRVASLPKFLVVQFMRFRWRSDTNKKAKVLRRMTFPVNFDITEYCETKLKGSLMSARTKIMEEESKMLGLESLTEKKKGKKGKGKSKKEEKAKEPEPVSAEQSALEAKVKVPPHDTTSGQYSLFGVVTHKGRYADAGHYVGWVKQAKKGESSISDKSTDKDVWHKFDDDVVSTATTDDILALCGGGDWHCSYLCLYARVDDMPKRREEWAAFAKKQDEEKTKSATETKDEEPVAKKAK
jgi:ubiquitin carboxyl-terminal hydrolase 14